MRQKQENILTRELIEKVFDLALRKYTDSTSIDRERVEHFNTRMVLEAFLSVLESDGQIIVEAEKN